MKRESKKMSEVKSSSWYKLFEIKTKAKTFEGMINAINRECDYLYEMEKEDIEKLFDSDWITICNDGIIIWADGVYNE